MFKSIARLGAAFIAAFTLSLPAAASTFSIDYTDLWGGGQPNPTENGWGLNLIQQGDIIFATMFVYGSDNTPRWYSASSLSPSGGSTTWTGVLAQTTGPYFGATWNNAQVVPTIVGNMTVTFSSANSGTLSYSVNGVNVTKSISRFSLRAPNLAGRYLGGATALCNNNTSNAILIFDNLTVSQSGTTVSMAVDFFNAQSVRSLCTYNGNINTTGRTGSITGTFSCSGGANNTGNFSITNLESSINGFNGNFNASDQFCSNIGGRFGGVRDVL
jgi:hypothetical protein